MLPTLSCFSVSFGPGNCLRHWCSIWYLRISLLHQIFHYPLPNSRLAVSKAAPKLSFGISPLTYKPTWAPFTPSKSGQLSPPTYYRGCWHVVSRGFLWRYNQRRKSAYFSLLTGVYIQKYFILHAALLLQPFGHWAIFLTAASRRSLDRVSVPVWLIILSDQLLIAGLVGYYSANYLIRRRLIFRPRRFNNCLDVEPLHYLILVPLSRNYVSPKGRLPTCYSPVRHLPSNIATESSVDLHVLSTPPAFVLSQDQTLHYNFITLIWS